MVNKWRKSYCCVLGILFNLSLIQHTIIVLCLVQCMKDSSCHFMLCLQSHKFFKVYIFQNSFIWLRHNWNCILKETKIKTSPSKRKLCGNFDLKYFLLDISIWSCGRWRQKNLCWTLWLLILAYFCQSSNHLCIVLLIYAWKQVWNILFQIFVKYCRHKSTYSHPIQNAGSVHI